MNDRLSVKYARYKNFSWNPTSCLLSSASRLADRVAVSRNSDGREAAVLDVRPPRNDAITGCIGAAAGPSLLELVGLAAVLSALDAKRSWSKPSVRLRFARSADSTCSFVMYSRTVVVRFFISANDIRRVGNLIFAGPSSVCPAAADVGGAGGNVGVYFVAAITAVSAVVSAATADSLLMVSGTVLLGRVLGEILRSFR